MAAQIYRTGKGWTAPLLPPDYPDPLAVDTITMPPTQYKLATNDVVEVGLLATCRTQLMESTCAFLYSPYAGQTYVPDLSDLLNSVMSDFWNSSKLSYNEAWQFIGCRYQIPADIPVTEGIPAYEPLPKPPLKASGEYLVHDVYKGQSINIAFNQELPTYVAASIQKNTSEPGRNFRGGIRVYVQSEASTDGNTYVPLGDENALNQSLGWIRHRDFTNVPTGIVGSYDPVVFSRKKWNQNPIVGTRQPWMYTAKLQSLGLKSIMGSQVSRKQKRSAV